MTRSSRLNAPAGILRITDRPLRAGLRQSAQKRHRPGRHGYSGLPDGSPPSDSRPHTCGNPPAARLVDLGQPPEPFGKIHFPFRKGNRADSLVSSLVSNVFSILHSLEIVPAIDRSKLCCTAENRTSSLSWPWPAPSSCERTDPRSGNPGIVRRSGHDVANSPRATLDQRNGQRFGKQVADLGI